MFLICMISFILLLLLLLLSYDMTLVVLDTGTPSKILKQIRRFLLSDL